MHRRRGLLTQWMRRAFSFAFASAGRSSDARMAMMAMTTSNSMSVNAPRTRSTKVVFGELGMSGL
jgi:ABC-type enterochelin transport system substrate-binding protein